MLDADQVSSEFETGEMIHVRGKGTAGMLVIEILPSWPPRQS